MKLLKLAPESQRLRRMAKAFAAGELSRIDYREARRQIIDNFVPYVADDDTQPRGEVTKRNFHAEREPDQGPKDRLWPKLALATVMIVAIFALTANAFAGAGSIPPVAQRDPNPNTSPRLQVSSIRVRLPDATTGVDADEVQGVIEKALEEIRDRNGVADHGFNGDELDEIGRFLAAVGVHDGGARLTNADINDLNELIAGQKSRRGVSIKEIEEVSMRVQEYYRAMGYFLAVAFVPSQAVEEGNVWLEVLPGRLGSVAVDGGEANLAEAAFADLIGKPLTRQMVETKLYELNTLPGFSTHAAFVPGANVGETQLNLQVLEAKAWSGLVRIDNDGNEESGRERLSLQFGWLNPIGRGDALDVRVMNTVDPSDQTYISVGYRTPFISRRYQGRIRVSNNDFSWQSNPEVDSDSLLIDLSASRTLVHTRARGSDLWLGTGSHDIARDGFEDQKAYYMRFGIGAHRVWDAINPIAFAANLAVEGRMSLDVGRVSSGAVPGQDSEFWRLGASGRVWWPVDLPFVGGQQKVSLSAAGQLSGSQLPSTLRLGVGGANDLRGFDPGTYMADQGAYVSLGLHFPLPVGELVWFADTAYAVQKNQLTPTWAQLTNVGIGWDLEILPNLTSRLSWSIPLTTKRTGGLEDEGSRIYWSLQLSR